MIGSRLHKLTFIKSGTFHQSNSGQCLYFLTWGGRRARRQGGQGRQGSPGDIKCREIHLDPLL